MTEAISEKPQWWDQAVKEISAADPVMARLIQQSPEGHLESRGSPFETLLRSVIGQQISVKAAQNIWARFVKACPDLTPESIRRKHRKTLRATGLSERKVDFVLDICRFFIEEKNISDSFDKLTDEQVIEALCTIKGVGLWTAQMFLIFTLRRPNVAPLVDYGFLKALSRTYFPDVAFDQWNAKERKEEILSLTNRWDPWKTVATWYLWRSLNNDPMQY